jgi:hypothetical protein
MKYRRRMGTRRASQDQNPLGGLGALGGFRLAVPYYLMTPKGDHSARAPRAMPSTPSGPPVAARTGTRPRLLAAQHDEREELRFFRLSRMAWATLYRRVFDIDPLECSSCGGRLRFFQVIEDPGLARSELRRRSLPAEPPPLSRARAPDWLD